MRKILICTPLRGDLPATYLNTLFRVMNSRTAGLSFAYAFLGVPAIQWARDECVQLARDKGCTEIVFWDKDLEPTAQDWVRLLSHENLEIVCGLYSKREIPTHWHATFIDGKEPGIDGLCEVFQSAIGFSKIRMSAFDKILARTPERRYTIHNAGEGPRTMHEYFPMERFGPNTAAAKLERITNIVLSAAWYDGKELHQSMAELLNIVNDSDYSSNQMHGEDYSFCRLAKEAGVPIMLDTQLVIPHNGNCSFPVKTEILEAELAQAWRRQA